MNFDTESGDVLLLEFTSQMALDEGGLSLGQYRFSVTLVDRIDGAIFSAPSGMLFTEGQQGGVSR